MKQPHPPVDYGKGMAHPDSHLHDSHPAATPAHGSSPHDAHAPGSLPMMPAIRASVITVSDRSSRGQRPDASGPRAVDILAREGYEVAGATIIPDGIESVRNAIQSAVDSGARLVVTSGGTGVSPRDLTPEGTRALLMVELPGISEALRREGEKQAAMAVISRGLAGIVESGEGSKGAGAGEGGGTATGGGAGGAVADDETSGGMTRRERALVVNLPGSERAVAQGLGVLLPLVPHILDQLTGGDH